MRKRINVSQKHKRQRQSNEAKDSQIGQKVLFFVIVAPIVLCAGMLFPGIAHGVLAYAAWYLYKEIFNH